MFYVAIRQYLVRISSRQSLLFVVEIIVRSLFRNVFAQKNRLFARTESQVSPGKSV